VAKLPMAHDDCIANLLHLIIVSLGPIRTSKMKYTWNCCLMVLPFLETSFSTTRAPLTTECVVDR
jgi:hypothetical protein